MKKILLASTIAASLFANDNFVELGFGFSKSKDNFSTEQNKNISTLGSAEDETQAIPYFDLHYAYNLSDQNNIYVDAGFNGLKLGSEFNTNLGFFDIGLKADLMGEEWANPFLTGTNREETDTKEFGAYIAYGLVSNKSYSSTIRYEISKKSYDKDTVSTTLKRDGIRNIIALENMYHSSLFDSPVTYLNNLSFENYDADGKASSYNEFNIELGLTNMISKQVRLTVLANVGQREYDEINPELNKTIDVDIYGLKAVLKYDEPFNYKDTYVSLKTGIENEKANDDFYDKENTFGIVSLGYKF